MAQAVAFPGVDAGVQGKWSDSPLNDLKLFLEQCSFKPTTVHLCFEGDIYAVERVCGLPSPDRPVNDVFEVVKDYPLTCEWSSYDGRAVDVLRLSGPFDAQKVTTLVATLLTQLSVVYRRDLEITLSAP